MEQQAPIPQIKDEAARRAKRAIFPSLILGERRGEESRFSIYFVQNKMVQQTPIPPNHEAARRAKRAIFPSFFFFFGGGGGRV